MPRWSVGLALFTACSAEPGPSDTASDHDTEETPTTPPTPDTGTTSGTSGCGGAALQSGTFAFDHGGVSRTYALQVPSTYDGSTPLPLVFAFHGWGGSEDEYMSSAVVTNESDARGYILVAPRGIGSGAPDQSLNSWSFRGSTTGLDGAGDAICDDDLTTNYRYGSCEDVATNGCSWTQCQDDDVDFVLALLDALEAGLCIDASRVFATGGSNGGMFTWELAQDERSAPRIRAIAPLIGLPHRGHLDGKGRPDDLPVLLVTGTEDRTVPPGEWEDPAFTTTSDGDRYYYTGATAISRVFAEDHGCDTSVPAVAFDEGVPDLECRTYCAGDAGWPRALDCRRNMGHTYQFSWSWPLVLDFFDQWQ